MWAKKKKKEMSITEKKDTWFGQETQNPVFFLNRQNHLGYDDALEANDPRRGRLVDRVGQAELTVAVVAPSEHFSGLENSHGISLAARNGDHLQGPVPLVTTYSQVLDNSLTVAARFCNIYSRS